MMTVHKLSTGDGYRYYTHEVASGDALRSNDRELGDYYTVTGMPPGQWVGSSVHELGVSGNVTEAQMHALFGGTKKPLSPEQFSEIEALAQQQYAKTYATSVADARDAFVSETYAIMWANLVEGKTQKAISEEFSVTQQTISNRINSQKKGYTKYAFKAEKPTYEQFKALFVFSAEQIQRIERTARNQAEEAREKVRTDLGSQLTSAEYKGVETEFTQAVQARINEHIGQHGTEPTSAQKRQYRLALGAQRFYEEHKYRPENEELIRFIQRLEKPQQQSIAGYDLVFSPTKSVSIAWGLGTEQMRQGIEAAHEKAIADVVKYLEENALYTRRGQGGIEQIDVNGGIIATKFRHYDSREGDPNLHDHLVIANRVKGSDGQWSTIDGRDIYGYGVSASELYNSRIMTYINQNLGFEFKAVERKGKYIFELAGIDGDTIKAFSSRRASITAEYEKVHEQFIEEHGYEPNAKQIKQLYQQVTLSTRPTKEHAKSLKDLHETWVEKAHTLDKVKLPTGKKLKKHLHKASAKSSKKIIEEVGDFLETPIAKHAQNIISILEESRATWSDRHIDAETQRYIRNQTHGKGASESTTEQLIKLVKSYSISMDITSVQEVPDAKLRRDGTSVYTRAGAHQYTTERIINAEKDLLDAAMTPFFSPASKATFEKELAKHKKKNQISAAQENMARVFSTSDTLLAVGIGPAGAGKTTSTQLTVKTVQAQGRQIIGLAPTAAAASVMSKELGITATTLDRYLMLPENLSPGDVLLVDEVGMVATPKLHKLLEMAKESGAVIRGMGDTRQLSAVGAGGALRLIEREAGAVYLEDIFRFRNDDGTTNEQEAHASMLLREPPATGADKPFQFYIENDRVIAGNDETMLNKVFEAWNDDVAEGKKSIMLAPNNQAVSELNLKAQVQAIAAGKVNENGRYILGRDENTVYTGDTIVTRKNNRELWLRGAKDFVKNGDQWEVLRVNKDGSLYVKNMKHRGKITLPAEYVSSHVELGYACTIHRAQGVTVDTVHAYVDKSTDRAGAYVGLTRGKYSNRLYVATDEETSRDDVLDAITQNYDRNLSVHEEIERLRAQDRHLATRMKVYESLAEHSMIESFKTMARNTLEPELASSVVSSEGFGALAHELDTVYRAGLDPKNVLVRAASWREIDSADDPAAVLQWRVKATVEHHRAVVAKRDARPLGNYSDETLAKMLTRAEAALPSKVDDAQLEDPRWASRPYALVKTEKLQEMRTRTFTLLRAKEDSKDPYIAELKENAYAMDAEWIRRAHMSKEQKAVEQFVRGEKRRDHLFTLASAIRSEVWLRKSSLPLIDEAKYAQKPGEKISGGISEYSVDSFWATNPLAKPENKAILKAHRQQMNQLVQLRGRQLADESPAWVKELGEVPAYGPAAQRWYRVAAEVEAYRDYYQIPAGEETAIPKKYRESEKGQYLQGQITAVHKSSRLSSTLVSAETKAADAQVAQDQQRRREVPSEAEQVAQRPVQQQEIAHVQKQIDEIDQKQNALTEQMRPVQEEIEKLKDATVAAEQTLKEQRRDYSRAKSQGAWDIDEEFKKVRQAEQEVEKAGLFGKGKARARLQAAREQFASAHGGSLTPEDAKKQWLPGQKKVREVFEVVDSTEKRIAGYGSQADTQREKLVELQKQYSTLAEKRRNLRTQKQRLFMKLRTAEDKQRQIEARARGLEARDKMKRREGPVHQEKTL